MRYAFAAPIVQGQTEACRRLIADLAGPRQAEFADLQRRSGVSEETYWLQEGPEGDLLIVVTDSDQQRFAELMANPEKPFDEWFRERIQSVFGFDPATMVNGPPIPQPLFEWRA